jgi:trk system potassium uptake protein
MKHQALFNGSLLFPGSIAAIIALVIDFGYPENFWRQFLTDIVYLLFGLLSFFYNYQLWRSKQHEAMRWRRYALLSFSAILVLLAAANLIQLGKLQVLVAIMILSLAVLDISERLYTLKRQALHPALSFVLSFFILICIGTTLLMLPSSTVAGISPIDAWFTATSAVCVTGLVVLDTGQDFTFFGQVVILGLFQAGGIGILAFTNLFGLLFRGYGSYRNRLMLKDMINADDFGNTFGVLVKIIVFTFLLEGLGAVLIFYALPMEGGKLGENIFFAIFHAVSAFCNAGFSTLSNSLYDVNFRFNYGLQMVVIVLIIIGGLGYNVVINYYGYAKKSLLHFWRVIILREKDRSYHRAIISINTRLVSYTTILLLAVGTAAFYFLEQHNTLAEHQGWGKLVTSFFGAVTPRTAGFNTVDVAAMALPMLLIYLLLMWIGASPGSTGGGVKTTTFAVAAMTVYQQMLGNERITIGWRQIPQGALQRAMAIIFLSLVAIGSSIFIVMILDGHLGLLPVAFECFSAFSTVGLSMGITSSLSEGSKLALSATMLVGRVGFLTILAGIARQLATPTHNPIQYPEEEIFIN